MFNELKFHKEFKNNYKDILPRSEIIYSEKPLYSYSDIIKEELNFRQIFEENKYKINKKQIGRIDLVLRYKSRNYCVEIKYYPTDSVAEFWDATKVLAYSEYLNFCEKPKQRYIPAIMLPTEKIFVETLVVATRLNITLFGISEINKTFSVKKIDDDFKPKY